MTTHNQKGVTLLELLMVVGIASVIAVSALVFFRTTDESTKVSLEAKNLATLTAGITNMFNAQGHYDGLTNTVLYNSNVVPDSMRGPFLGNLNHSWNTNSVFVRAFRVLSANYNDAFEITYYRVPQKSCFDLMSKTMNYYKVARVNNNNVSSIADASTACSSPTNNTLQWRMW